VCGRPASSLLLVRVAGDGPWMAYPRCEEHHAGKYGGLMDRMLAAGEWLALDLASPAGEQQGATSGL
jgi:hypothetical protein